MSLIGRALGLTDPLVAKQLQALFSAHPVAKAAPLLRQGELWSQAFFIERGLLRMHFIGRDGKEFNKNFHAEGTMICPLTEAMQTEPSLFAITAVEASVVWQASAAALVQLLDAQGAWAPLRTRLLDRLITHKLQREHALLTLDGSTRYQQLCEREPHLAERVPLSQLASYLGLTDVSLSRIRRKLKAQSAA